MLRVQEYDFNVIYKSGAENPADFLSRHPPESHTTIQKEAEEYVKCVTHAAVPQSMTLKEVAIETQKGCKLCAVRAAISSGYWNTDSGKDYKQVRHEITIDDNNCILLLGSRIILPTPLQAWAVKLAHEGTKVKQKKLHFFVNVFGFQL